MSAPMVAELLEALAPFVDIGPQRGAWGVVSKKLDGLAPLTVTVTKAQMLAAIGAIAKARGMSAGTAETACPAQAESRQPDGEADAPEVTQP